MIIIQLDLKTFGANIHDLLINGFFMKQTLGEFSLSQINEILEFHRKVFRYFHNKEIDNLKKDYSMVKDKFYFICDNLKIMSNILKNHIEAIEEKLEETAFFERQIQTSENELLTLEFKKAC